MGARPHDEKEDLITIAEESQDVDDIVSFKKSESI
jgi:hypothetical protein